MKTNSFFFAAICMFLLGNTTQLQAQKINCWKGGTPGQATNWNCPKNWSASQVPDEFQNVIIPDVSSSSGVYPTISEPCQEVNALVLESGASLTITKSGGLNVLTTMEEHGNSEMKLKGKLLIIPTNGYAGTMKTADNNELAVISANKSTKK